MRKAFFLTSGPPVPIVGARRIRDAQIISLLAKRMPVEVHCIARRTEMPSIQASAEKQFGSPVSVFCHPLDEPNILIRSLDLVRPHFAQGYSKSIESALLSRANPGDFVWLSRLRMAKYVALARKLGCFSVLDEHQVESDLLFDNAFTRMRYWHQGLTAAQCALYEKKLSYAADLVVTASPIDTARIRKLAPNTKVQVIPPAIDTQIYLPLRPDAGPHGNELLDLSFIGDLDYQPNLHALEWIRDELIPRLEACRAKPKIRVHSQNREIEKIASTFPNFEFITYTRTEELIEQLRPADVAIFPLRYGRGNRIHVLEAVGAGIPVVSTGRGVDGLAGLTPLDDICIAEAPDEFASLVLRAAQDAEFRKNLIECGLKTVQAKYDWLQTAPALDSLFSTLGVQFPD
jgi:glycosyltransferase involved in cell wall biosynthesis